jgi:hypothetical protein
MPAERVRWLNVWAAETDRTVSDVVLEALDHYIGEVERVHGKYRGFVNESGEAEVPSKGVRGLETDPPGRDTGHHRRGTAA